MDMKRPREEIVKCVLVGDTAVGKTRLVCAKACNTYLSVAQLLTLHVPTVWAIDQYRTHQEVLRRSWKKVDEVNVSLRLWDTFGNHDNNRIYAYGRSDVILLCFSISNPQSFRNCQKKWYPEIRKNCPHTPVILVGCKNDLRHIFQEKSFMNLYRNKKCFARLPKENDLTTREQGLALAAEIGVQYYEASVLTHYGVDDVFENAIRAALIARRQQSFWSQRLRNVQLPLLQKPYCPPRPPQPKTKVLMSTYENEMITLLEDEYYTDVSLVSADDVTLNAHKCILAAASPYFRNLFRNLPIDAEAEDILTVTTFQEFSLSTLRDYLRFVYSGSVKLTEFSNMSELMEIAVLTDDLELQIVLDNVNNDCETKSLEAQLKHLEILQDNMKEVCLDENMGADILFKLDDGIILAHRSILMARCDVMAAMFGGNFKESSARIVSFPGVTKECFNQLLVYLYTDALDLDLCASRSLALLELSNRLCLLRVTSLIEKYVILELLEETCDESIDVAEDVCHLLEFSQMHNASQLVDWCQYFITVNYQEILANSAKHLRNLQPENRAYLNKNRWPSALYLKEITYYEKHMHEKEKKEKSQRFLKWKKTSGKHTGCFCFWERKQKHLENIEHTPISSQMPCFLET